MPRSDFKCAPGRCKVLSYGGGLDSFAMLLDAVDRGEKPDAVVFIDVGDSGPTWEGKDPGEWPGTYRHIREVVIPFCKKHGIHFEWLTYKDYAVRAGTEGEARSLFQWMKVRGQIPVVGPNRICTTVAKVERFERWLDDHFPGEKVQVWIGFEAGEESRAAKDPNAGTGKVGRARRENRFPLMERNLCRCRAEDLVRRKGFPIPRKSACVFCGYGTRADFQALERELPKQWRQVVELEAEKPVTGKGMKLSIKGYKTIFEIDGQPLTDKLAEELGFESPAAVFKAGTKSEDPTLVYLRLPGRSRRLTVRRISDPTMLPDFVHQPEGRSAQAICKVCGSERATKAVGCDYLEERPRTAGKGRALPVVDRRHVQVDAEQVAGRQPPRKPHRGDVVTADELVAEALRKFRP